MLTSKALETLAKWGTGVIGLAMVSSLILPGRRTADVLNAINGSFGGMVRTMMGAMEAIEERDINLAWEFIYEMSSDAQLDLLTDLTDEDFEWLERMSTNL